MEVSMTRNDSEISVIFNGEYLIVDFPFDYKIINILKTIEDADWNNRMEKRWTIPRSGYIKLVKATENLGNRIIWKTPEEMKTDAKALNFKEETLEDVLSRIPSKINTDYLKIEPYDFQKVAVGWAITEKGKRGKVYGGLLADLMG